MLKFIGTYTWYLVHNWYNILCSAKEPFKFENRVWVKAAHRNREISKVKSCLNPQLSMRPIIRAFLLFASVAKSKSLVASQIHEVRSIPDVTLITKLLEETFSPTLVPTPVPTPLETPRPTATAPPSTAPPSTAPPSTARPTQTIFHAVGTVNQVSTQLLKETFVMDFNHRCDNSSPGFQIQQSSSQYDTKELRYPLHIEGYDSRFS